MVLWMFPKTRCRQIIIISRIVSSIVIVLATYFIGDFMIDNSIDTDFSIYKEVKIEIR